MVYIGSHVAVLTVAGERSNIPPYSFSHNDTERRRVKFIHTEKTFVERVPTYTMKVHVETLDGLFRDLELTISEDGIDIANTDFGAHSYIIPWQEITAVDAGNLHPYKVNKIAIECRPRGRKTMLVKLYVPALPDVDALAQELLRRGMKAKHGRIPTPLHHPRMLRYYTPALRYALTIVSKFYRFLTFFGLVCLHNAHYM
jgi:hypothetical protein